MMVNTTQNLSSVTELLILQVNYIDNHIAQLNVIPILAKFIYCHSLLGFFGPLHHCSFQEQENIFARGWVLNVKIIETTYKQASAFTIMVETFAFIISSNIKWLWARTNKSWRN